MNVDVAFKITSQNPIPCDHGYFIAGAISNIVPTWHGDSQVAIHPIAGRIVGSRRMALNDKSRVRIRIGANRIAECIPLAGKAIRIGTQQCQLGTMQVELVRPAETLRARTVTIKGYIEGPQFHKALTQKVRELGIGPTQIEVSKRRTLNIKGAEVVGFEVYFHSLTAPQSLEIQAGSMWSRRRFGCGVFVPAMAGNRNERT